MGMIFALLLAAPCDGVTAPAGMVCTAHENGTVFVDQQPVANQDYQRCVKAGVCAPLGLSGRAHPSTLKFDSTTKAAAQRYCAWRGKRLGPAKNTVHCAADEPFLDTPPLWHLNRRERQPLPPMATAEQQQALNAVRHDSDVDARELCPRRAMASHSCRDRLSYIKSNEGLRRLFAPYIKNLGGGYVGLGADQAYDHIAVARSQWAWLFDWDPAVVSVHHIVRAVIIRSKTPDEFVAALAEENQARVEKWIRASLGDEPDEIKRTMLVFARIRGELEAIYSAALERAPEQRPAFGWLAHGPHYRYVRALYRRGRIVIRRGNLLSTGTLRDIAASARALGVPVRVYYESNAADMWPLTETYFANMSALPVDPGSVVLRTVGAHKVGAEVDGNWVYVVHGASHFQRALSREAPEMLRELHGYALPTRYGERLVTIGLPSTKSLTAPDALGSLSKK